MTYDMFGEMLNLARSISEEGSKGGRHTQDVVCNLRSELTAPSPPVDNI